MIGLKNSYEIAYNGTENECRFELYADTASELQGLTHFDGIKIQMGSECTDIATGDKYILNGSGVWVLQPSANAWENVYTIQQIDNMFTTLYQYMLYYHTAQESANGSITFYTLGTPVGSLTIYGNGQQTGTPTPDNPIIPEFVGVRTGNLFPQDSFTGKTTVVRETFNDIASSIVFGNGQYTLSMDVTTEPTSGIFKFCFTYTDDSQDKSPWITKRTPSIVLVSNANKVVKSISITDYNNYTDISLSNIMLNTGDTALPYEPFGWAEKITCAGQTVPIYLGEVQTVRRVKKLVLTGEENITSTHTDIGLFNIPVTDYLKTADTITNICSHYRAEINANDWSDVTDLTCRFYGNAVSPSKLLYIRDSSFSTVADFKAYIASEYQAGHPVTVWYVLAEPTTGIVSEPLAKIGDYADELHITDADVSIPTVSGENTLTVDTTLPPSKIVISGE